MDVTKRYMRYEDFRHYVSNGDLLLWRPTSATGRLICLGSSLANRRWMHYSHASMAAWGKNGRLYNLEMLQFHGGRHMPLSKQITQYPKSCELWRPNNVLYDGDGAVAQMMWLMGAHYGWKDFARISVRTLFPRIVLPRAVNTEDPDQPLVCSSSYAWAARTGGMIAPCPEKPDIDVSPADLALSGFADYCATPIP